MTNRYLLILLSIAAPFISISCCFSSPVTIVANKMTLMQKENKAIAEGNVVSQQDDKKLLSDKLVAFFEKQAQDSKQTTNNSSPQDTSNVKTIVATTLNKEKPINLTTPQMSLNCSTSLTYEVPERKTIALGNVRLKNIKDNYTMLAPKVVAYFLEEKEKTSPKQDIEKLYGFNGVTIIRGQQTAKGKRTVYKSKEQTIELFDDVTLLDNRKKLTGNYAHMDLEKGISKVFAKKKSQKRNQEKVRMLLLTQPS